MNYAKSVVLLESNPDRTHLYASLFALLATHFTDYELCPP